MMRAYTTYTHGGSNYSENEESSKRLLLRHNDSNLISTSQKVLCFPNKVFRLVSRYYVCTCYYAFTVKLFLLEKSVNSYFFLGLFLLVCLPTVKKNLQHLISKSFKWPYFPHLWVHTMHFAGTLHLD